MTEQQLIAAWLVGKKLEYMQTLSYDAWWTEYTNSKCPNFNDERWVWRIKE